MSSTCPMPLVNTQIHSHREGGREGKREVKGPNAIAHQNQVARFLAGLRSGSEYTSAQQLA